MLYMTSVRKCNWWSNGAEGMIWTSDSPVFSRVLSQAELPRHLKKINPVEELKFVFDLKYASNLI